MARRTEGSELRYAVRIRVVLKYLGQLCLVVAALTLVPIVVSLIERQWGMGVRQAVVTAFLLAFGLAASRLHEPAGIQRNEALVVAAGIFLLTSLIMTLPLCGTGLPFLDAWFETVSATTTTGLSTAGSADDLPPAFLFARAWMQWYGGLGIVVLALGLAAHPGTVARQMALSNTDSDDIIGGTRAHARRTFLVYCIITAACILLLWIAGASPFDAVVHALAAVSTGGFSSHDDSLAGAGGVAVATITVLFCIACAMPLSIYRELARRKWRLVVSNPQVWGLLVCAAITVLLLWGLMTWRSHIPAPLALRQAFIQAVSAQSTAGFSTTDIATLDAGSKLVMIGSMAIGGATASTAGGFKILRLLILGRILQMMLVRTSLSRDAVSTVRLSGDRLDPAARDAAASIVVLFVAVVFLSWAFFVVAGHDPLNSLFEVVSATGTVGLSTGVASPELGPGLKAVLIFDMLMGRVEFIALLVLLYPRTWFGRRMHAS